MKKTTLGIAYVSIWVIIWGTIGSLIDFPLLKSDIYVAGSIFQYITFFITFLITLTIAIPLYTKIVTRYFE